MRVVIRADASTQIGTGHVLRCMALGQAIKDGGGEVRLLACEIPAALAERMKSEGIEVVVTGKDRGTPDDLEDTVERSKGWADAIVLDGYKFDHAFQSGVKGAGFKTLVIDDDLPSDQFVADILLNQNLHAKEELYAGSNVDTMLLGLKYALLRREFREQPNREASVRSRNVLVTLGGSDSDNVTKKVIDSLNTVSLTGLKSRVLIGAGNPNAESLKQAADASRGEVEILRDVTNMREQYEWADIAISGGGSTVWELAFMGLPSLVIILADNQEKIAKSVWRAGTGVLLGWHHKVKPEQIAKQVRDLLVSSESRDRMGRWAQGQVDGQGAVRVADALREAVG